MMQAEALELGHLTKKKKGKNRRQTAAKIQNLIYNKIFYIILMGYKRILMKSWSIAINDLNNIYNYK